MIVRAITCNDQISGLIRAREGTVDKAYLGFVPSHVEIVVPEGYLGAHDDGGVQIRPTNYDAATLSGEAFFTVPLPDEQAAESYARSKIGTPYDFFAILDFVLPLGFDPAANSHAICSAFVRSALTAGKRFTRLVKPAWNTDPLDIAFLLSGQEDVTIKQTLPKP